MSTMTDTGPTTGEIEVEAPIKRAADDVLAARQQVTISKQGTLAPINLAQQLEVAQAMAKAGSAIPAHLRGSPGACLAVLEFSHGWGFMAYAVANKSYVVKDRLCFESQLIHSVIEMHAPLHEDNLNFEFVGEPKTTRRCRIWAQCKIRGKIKTLVWEGTEVGKIQPKNSPLWETKEDLQLFFNSSRDWSRVYFPHILLGAYTKEEMEDTPAELAKDVTPKGIAARLQGTAGREGFQPEHVEVIRTAQGTTGAASELDMVAADVVIGKEVVPVGRLQSVASERSEEAIATQPQPPQSEAGADAKEQHSDSRQAGSIREAFEKEQEAVLNQARQERMAAEGRLARTGEPKPEPPQEPAAAPPAAEGAPPQTAEPKKTTRKPKPEVEPKPAGPTTPEQYIEHVRIWIGRTYDDAYIHDRWADEKDLRGRCMVTGEHFEVVRKLRDDRLKEIGS
jgi:hypothetical protein